MKRKIFFKASLLLVAGMLAACSSNDDNEDNNGTRNGKIDVTKAVEFKVDFADYNDNGETDMTRTNSNGAVLQQQTVNLGNGILALCTLQRDTTKQAKSATTRTLPNDTYTMLAYDHATHAFKGEVTGTITGGVFRYSGDKAIELEPGMYDFVLFNSKLQRNGNYLTVTRANASDAFIGRTTQAITATPYHQLVPFTMKHAAAKVKFKLTGYMDFPAVTAVLTPKAPLGFITGSTYDASTATWQAAQHATENIPFTFNAATAATDTYVSTSNEEVYFTPKAEVGYMDFRFNSGTIYQQNMSGNMANLKAMKLDPNGAYVLNIKLLYNFLYLFSDGTIGYITETVYGGATAATAKTPIALVASQSKRFAIALKDANGGNKVLQWGKTNMQTSTNMDNTTLTQYVRMNGYEETWTTACSTDGIIKGSDQTNYPAFYIAGTYDPETTVTGANVSKWYLPTLGQWSTALQVLNTGIATQPYPTDLNNWEIKLANVAFTQVGGTPLQSGNTVFHPYPGGFPGGTWDHEFYAYWSSSEYDTKYGWVVGLVKKGYRINMGYQKDLTPYSGQKIGVRSFVNF
ncbi:fimbrillin family protein [Segatella maculosa]|uniref:fimbrillin family protein n=1 Tax=Segatella maculosa TaxID=439703 RepID=UPI000369213A|nr:fimbrillin family protein [Segatella maculosa]